MKIFIFAMVALISVVVTLNVIAVAPPVIGFLIVYSFLKKD